MTNVFLTIGIFTIFFQISFYLILKKYFYSKVICPACNRNFFISKWLSFSMSLNVFRVATWRCENCKIPIGFDVKSKFFKESKKKQEYILERVFELIWTWFLSILCIGLLTFLFKLKETFTGGMMVFILVLTYPGKLFFFYGLIPLFLLHILFRKTKHYKIIILKLKTVINYLVQLGKNNFIYIKYLFFGLLTYLIIVTLLPIISSMKNIYLQMFFLISMLYFITGVMKGFFDKKLYYSKLSYDYLIKLFFICNMITIIVFFFIYYSILVFLSDIHQLRIEDLPSIKWHETLLMIVSFFFLPLGANIKYLFLDKEIKKRRVL